MQTILAGMLISTISTILLLTLCSPVNATISNKLLEFMNSSNLTEISIISINIPTILINIGMVMVVTALSCLIPILKLNKIKPKNIIARDEK